MMLRIEQWAANVKNAYKESMKNLGAAIE